MKAIIVEIEGNRAVALNKDGGFIKLRNKVSYRIGYEVEIPIFTGLQKDMVTRLASTAAILLVAAGLSYGAYSYGRPCSYIDIDINPSIELTANVFNRIINAEGLNIDGKELVDTNSLKNKNIGDGVKELLKTAVKKGYLNHGPKDIVVFAVSGDDDKRLEKIENVVRTTASESLKAENRNPSILVKKATLKDHSDAKKMGITSGKLKLIEEVVKINPVLKADDLKNKPVGEIKKTIDEEEKELSDGNSKKGGNSGKSSNSGNSGKNRKDVKKAEDTEDVNDTKDVKDIKDVKDVESSKDVKNNKNAVNNKNDGKEGPEKNDGLSVMTGTSREKELSGQNDIAEQTGENSSATGHRHNVKKSEEQVKRQVTRKENENIRENGLKYVQTNEKTEVKKGTAAKGSIKPQKEKDTGHNDTKQNDTKQNGSIKNNNEDDKRNKYKESSRDMEDSKNAADNKGAESSKNSISSKNTEDKKDTVNKKDVENKKNTANKKNAANNRNTEDKKDAGNKNNTGSKNSTGNKNSTINKEDSKENKEIDSSDTGIDKTGKNKENTANNTDAGNNRYEENGRNTKNGTKSEKKSENIKNTTKNEITKNAITEEDKTKDTETKDEKAKDKGTKNEKTKKSGDMIKNKSVNNNESIGNKQDKENGNMDSNEKKDKKNK